MQRARIFTSWEEGSDPARTRALADIGLTVVFAGLVLGLSRRLPASAPTSTRSGSAPIHAGMRGPQLVCHPPGNAPDSGASGTKPDDAVSARRVACASRRILGMRVDATSYAETADLVMALAAERAGGMVCAASVNMVMEAHDDPGFRRIVNSADRVTPDGVPLVWGLRALGLRQASRVYGPSLMPEICARAAAASVPIALYGGTPEVLASLRDVLLLRYPGLEIPFAHSPPFRPLTDAEDRDLTGAIAASGARIVFVGIGCPKQERWMADHRAALDCILVGVGAAFDFLAGAKPQAPRWMQAVGLEWLFRLASEPRRLWRRYLLGNSRFLFHFVLRGNRG